MHQPVEVDLTPVVGWKAVRDYLGPERTNVIWLDFKLPDGSDLTYESRSVRFERVAYNPYRWLQWLGRGVVSALAAQGYRLTESQARNLSRALE